MDDVSHMDGMGNDVKHLSWKPISHQDVGIGRGVGIGLLASCSRKLLF